MLAIEIILNYLSNSYRYIKSSENEHIFSILIHCYLSKTNGYRYLDYSIKYKLITLSLYTIVHAIQVYILIVSCNHFNSISAHLYYRNYFFGIGPTYKFVKILVVFNEK